LAYGHWSSESRYLILGGLDEATTSSLMTPASKENALTSKTNTPTSSTPHLSRALKKILQALDGEMSRAAVMKAIGIKDRVTFKAYYLAPALKLGLVEMTQPSSPRSPTQKYRLTEKGRTLRVDE
jgi:hypothetical protein